jgi:hypothetical protein
MAGLMRTACRMYRILLLPVLLLPLATPVYAATSLPAVSSKAEYVVKRSGSPIGTLKIDFKVDGNGMVATSDYSIKIKLMAIVLYRYDKHMVEEYEDGRLIAYQTDIDDNGTKSQVRVARNPDALSIVHPKGSLSAPLNLLPSTYWPPATVKQTRMIDSSDGVLINVKTVEAATEDLTIDGRTIGAKRYVMSGDAVRELWYDAKSGAWLKMKFEGSDGSTIEIERDWPPVWKRDLL